jgi:hypothetical protein
MPCTEHKPWSKVIAVGLDSRIRDKEQISIRKQNGNPEFVIVSIQIQQQSIRGKSVESKADRNE